MLSLVVQVEVNVQSAFLGWLNAEYVKSDVFEPLLERQRWVLVTICSTEVGVAVPIVAIIDVTVAVTVG